MPISTASSPRSAQRLRKCRPPTSCPNAPTRHARAATLPGAKRGSFRTPIVRASIWRWPTSMLDERHYKPVDFDPFAEVEAHFPLTEPQREMCAATLMGDEANCSYNQCFVLKLHGPLSVDSHHITLLD